MKTKSPTKHQPYSFTGQLSSFEREHKYVVIKKGNAVVFQKNADVLQANAKIFGGMWQICEQTHLLQANTNGLWANAKVSK